MNPSKIIIVFYWVIIILATSAFVVIISTYSPANQEQQEQTFSLYNDSYSWVVNTNPHEDNTIVINKSYIKQIIETNDTIKIVMRQYPKED